MAFTDEDWKRFERLIDRKLDDRFRQKNISGQYKEIKNEIRKTQSDIEVDQTDARMGMERIMMDVLKTTANDLREVKQSIAPLAQKLADTESAAVVAGKNGISANGNATDAKLAANNGLRVSKQNRVLILLQAPAVVLIIKIIEHFLL